jgi:hypothetical protein
MILSEELSTIRNLLKEVNNNSNLEDSFIYSLWKQERALVISQELRRYNNVPFYLTKRFCLQLQKVQSVECDCDILQDMGCYILKSVKTIPNYITGGFKDSIQIYTLGNKKIGIIEPEVYKSDMLDPVKSRSMRAMIPNTNKLEIWNNPKNDMDYVYVRLIPSDPLQLANYLTCDGITCYDPLNEETTLSEEMAEKVRKLVVDSYRLTLQLPQDQSQDLNPNTK